MTNEGKEASLSDFKGQWVVLYFYPKDFTSGCTLEAHNFQRDIAKYEAAHAVILGVSTDNADSHKSFCAKEGLNFKLLADVDSKVSEQYGSIMEYNGAKYSARNTFIIDPKGKIAKVFVKVSPAGHSDEVLAALAGCEARRSPQSDFSGVMWLAASTLHNGKAMPFRISVFFELPPGGASICTEVSTKQFVLTQAKIIGQENLYSHLHPCVILSVSSPVAIKQVFVNSVMPAHGSSHS